MRRAMRNSSLRYGDWRMIRAMEYAPRGGISLCRTASIHTTKSKLGLCSSDAIASCAGLVGVDSSRDAATLPLTCSSVDILLSLWIDAAISAAC